VVVACSQKPSTFWRLDAGQVSPVVFIPPGAAAVRYGCKPAGNIVLISHLMALIVRGGSDTRFRIVLETNEPARRGSQPVEVPIVVAGKVDRISSIITDADRRSVMRPGPE
jgi:hypothetical protein